MISLEAIIFDFDGVLVDSVDTKTQAFAALYEQYGPQVVKSVIAYHRQHGGVSRYEKFRYFHESILGKEYNQKEEQLLGESFSRLVFDAVIAAPWIPGAYNLLVDYHKTIPMFVASGTPNEEIQRIVKHRKMDHFFVAVKGSPATKAQIIDEICINHGFHRDRVLMIGDSITDYEGAMKAGVMFVGYNTSEQNPFPPRIAIVTDLKSIATLFRLNNKQQL